MSKISQLKYVVNIKLMGYSFSILNHQWCLLFQVLDDQSVAGGCTTQ